jgi:hypothetical protein
MLITCETYYKFMYLISIYFVQDIRGFVQYIKKDCVLLKH